MAGRKLKLFVCFFCFFSLIACKPKKGNRLARALELAGDNRSELETVLAHYKEEPLKLQAAQFLISNMPGHTGYASSLKRKLQPVYDRHVALSEKYGWKRPVAWQKEISELWENANIDVSRFPRLQDVGAVKADWLIGEIELAFKAWQENVYTREISFEDFCHYILPYRFNDRFGLGHSRADFYGRHRGLFSDSVRDFRVVTDSLHFLYSDISHSAGAAGSMPIYDIGTYERLKRGVCEDQTRFNAHLMAALGMAVAIDFVPGWGNRTNGHDWNALIVNGKTYPFEPFWDKERWKYDRIYNNETFDLQYGRFRAPKVYRHTFECYWEGPMKDKKESVENIPLLFRNPRKKDVSKLYFKTSDVEIRLTEPSPDNTKYCYLCVYEAKNMTWTPVQWGRIEDGKVVFKEMGRDMVYLPAFYRRGKIVPAAPAFILDKEGKREVLKSGEKTQKVVVNATTPLGTQYGSLLAESRLMGWNDLTDAEQQDLLYKLSDTIDIDRNYFRLYPEKAYQYVCLHLKRDTIALNELSFYEEREGNPIRIPDVKVLPDWGMGSAEGIGRVTDYLSGTGCFASCQSGKKSVVFDLGRPCFLHGFSVVPFPEFHLNGEMNYTLYYWDNEWKPVEEVKGCDDFVSFGQVPVGGLYLMKSSVPVKGTYSNERIFTYANGTLNWW